MIFNTSMAAGNGGGASTAVPFTDDDWEESEASYILTISKQEHQRQNGDFTLGIWHNVDGALKTGTWAALGTSASYNDETGDVTLSYSEPYSGTAVFC